MPQFQLGLGFWSGTYEGITRKWLRWYDSDGNWILTPTEDAAVVQQEQDLRINTTGRVCSQWSSHSNPLYMEWLRKS